MPVISALTRDELSLKVIDTIQQHCAIAFAADCRLAMRWRFQSAVKWTVEYEWHVLSPGELPPAGMGWEVFENHSGIAVGRSA